MRILGKIRAFLQRRKRATGIAPEKLQPAKVEEPVRSRKPGDKIVSVRRRKTREARKRRKR
jgi:hypothetical protein